jgi:hypothetical protein
MICPSASREVARWPVYHVHVPVDHEGARFAFEFTANSKLVMVRWCGKTDPYDILRSPMHVHFHLSTQVVEITSVFMCTGLGHMKTMCAVCARLHS